MYGDSMRATSSSDDPSGTGYLDVSFEAEPANNIYDTSVARPLQTKPKIKLKKIKKKSEKIKEKDEGVFQRRTRQVTVEWGMLKGGRVEKKGELFSSFNPVFFSFLFSL